MSFEIGQKVGPYEVLDYFDNSRIGTGYKVNNTALSRVEVLRLLPKDPHRDSEAVERFLREIFVHSRLSHPNIVTFYSAVEIDGNLVMTTEYVPGITLARRIEQGAIPIETAVGWTCQILSALGYAHDNGVVHREVSPANIVVTQDGDVKLGGFGLAKGSNDPELTRVGTVMGWIEYMSPEQVQGLPRIDARSDLYSAGAVLYELLTGRVPFVASSQFEVMLAHVRETPRPPAEVTPAAPAELSALVMKALEKEPEKRFENAEAFRAALEEGAAWWKPQPKAEAESPLPETSSPKVEAEASQAAVEEQTAVATAVSAVSSEPSGETLAEAETTATTPAAPSQVPAEPAVVEWRTDASAEAASVEPEPEPERIVEAAPEAAPAAFTWRSKSDDELEIEAQAAARELAALEAKEKAMAAPPPAAAPLPDEPPSAGADLWNAPAAPAAPAAAPPTLEDELKLDRPRGYVHPPHAPVAPPREPLPTWKLVAVGSGAFVLMGLTMYAILKSLGG